MTQFQISIPKSYNAISTDKNSVSLGKLYLKHKAYDFEESRKYRTFVTDRPDLIPYLLAQGLTIKVKALDPKSPDLSEGARKLADCAELVDLKKAYDTLFKSHSDLVSKNSDLTNRLTAVESKRAFIVFGS